MVAWRPLPTDSSAIHSLLNPAGAWLRRLSDAVAVGDGTLSSTRLDAYGFTPTFRQPMSEPLADLSQEWVLPGLEHVPANTVALLKPNDRFIEAFMAGLNAEMGRELLWRDFPIADERATYFQHFWVKAPPAPDIPAIANWQGALGSNGSDPSERLVLLIRGKLLQRYPGAVVYAVPARFKKVNNKDILREPILDGSEDYPLFRGTLEPDVTFFGFGFAREVALGDRDPAKNKPGWYFVIQEQPTEPRFGFDVDDLGGVVLRGNHVSVDVALPKSGSAPEHSADVALQTRQQSVRVAIHAQQLIGGL